MTRFILLTLFVSLFNTGYSQRTAKVSATYTYYAPETMSVEEAKRTALERAKIQAIADEFGTIVSQSTSTVITNKNGESDTRFFALGGSDVKGEWIETTDAPVYSIHFEDHLLSVNCKVKGIIREILQPEIELSAKTLKNGLTLNFESSDFKDGDELYLHFRSSVAGNIIIYLIQGNIVYRLLPYKRCNSKEYYIEAGREYVFFSKTADTDNNGIIDEYQLFSDKEVDFGTVLIIYTPNSLDGSIVVEQIYDEPMSTDVETFNRWLIKKRNKDKNSRVLMMYLTIRKS